MRGRLSVSYPQSPSIILNHTRADHRLAFMGGGQPGVTSAGRQKQRDNIHTHTLKTLKPYDDICDQEVYSNSVVRLIDSQQKIPTDVMFLYTQACCICNNCRVITMANCIFLFLVLRDVMRDSWSKRVHCFSRTARCEFISHRKHLKYVVPNIELIDTSPLSVSLSLSDGLGFWRPVCRRFCFPCPVHPNAPPCHVPSPTRLGLHEGGSLAGDERCTRNHITHIVHVSSTVEATMICLAL